MTTAPRSRRAGRRALIAVLLVLALVLLAGIVVDRVAAGRAEAEASRQLQAELSTPNLPEVDIQGFPFLTQAFARKARTVRVQAENASTGEVGAAPARRLDLTADGVTVPEGNAPATADHVEGTATLDYAALPEVGGRPLTYAGDGRVAVELDASSLPVPVGAQVTGRPQLDEAQQTVTLAEPTITVAGVELPESVAGPIVDRVTNPVPVTGVPLGLRLTSLSVDDAGVQVGVVGDDVVLRG